MTPTAVNARAIRPFEYGVSCPPRKCRSPCAARSSRDLLRQPQQLGVEVAAVGGEDVAASAKTTSSPRSDAASATTSIAAAFSSIRKTSASTRARAVQRPVGERLDVHDVGAVLVAQVGREELVRRLGRGREEGDRTAGDVLHRAWPQGRRDHAAPAGSPLVQPSQPGPSSAIVSTTRSETRWRYSFR